MFKNLKARYVWITVGVLFLAAIGLIFAILNTNGGVNRALTIVLVIVFIFITFLVQYATFKTYNGRQQRKIKYPTKLYNTDLELSKALDDSGYKKTKREYGFSYLKIDHKIAYKVVLIDDINKYYNHTEDDNYEADKRLDSCKMMIGLEIFNEVNEEALRKIPDYSFEVKNVYYTALVLREDGSYVCLNYIEPNEYHKEAFENIFKDLGLNEVSE